MSGRWGYLIFMSIVHSEQEAINWYEGQERVLTKDYIATIPWHETKNHELDQAFLPVLLYMRDVEKFTEIYYKELMRTPTGKDPVIRRFMDKWAVEEAVHGDLINRFLEEAGHPTSDKWFEQAKKQIPKKQSISSFMAAAAARLTGHHFSAVHMTWGAINEFSTLTGYRTLWEKANHPVLTYLLKAIAKEEASHSFFYWTIARLKLQTSKFRQQLTRYIIKKFWSPVGQGLKRPAETNYVIKTLFSGDEGVAVMRDFVNKKIEQLPGLNGLTTITDRVAKISLH